MTEWINPQATPPSPGDHIKVVLHDGIVITGCARDIDEPYVIYQVIQPDPFIGRQNAEQPEVPRPPAPAPAAGPRRYKVRKTATNILSLDSESWVDTYRWKWLAVLQVWMSMVPHSTTVYIHAELVDD